MLKELPSFACEYTSQLENIQASLTKLEASAQDVGMDEKKLLKIMEEGQQLEDEKKKVLPRI